MPGQKLHSFRKQSEGMTMKLPLVEELVLVGATEPGKSQLALRVVRQKLAAEGHYRRIYQRPANAQTQPIQDVSQIIRGSISGQSTARNTRLDCPANLLHVKFIDRHVGNFVFPAMPGMRALQKNSLVCFLRHDRRGRPDALIRPSIVSAWKTVSHRCGLQNQDLKAARVHRDLLRFDRDGRIKAAQDLRKVLKSLVRQRLTDDRTVRPNADQYLSAPAIHEGAKRFSSSGELRRALLEFKLFGFTSRCEVSQFLERHRDDSTRQNPRPNPQSPHAHPHSSMAMADSSDV
jgi:hypothetical protein